MVAVYKEKTSIIFLQAQKCWDEQTNEKYSNINISPPPNISYGGPDHYLQFLLFKI
jgi:hypothetical protein